MDEADESPSHRGFEILSDETRVDILRALAEQLRESPEEPALGFATLRRRVGMRDSGNFNYHLGKLEGRFVTKTVDGYQLAPAGVEVVAALLTGVYGETTARGPTDLSEPCPACGDSLAATYESGLLRVHCPNDHVFRNALPPGPVEGRSMAGVVDLLTRKTRRDLALAAEGICPFCYARLDWDGDPAADADMPSFTTQCARCGVAVDLPVAIRLSMHPTVAAFYHDHGVDVRECPPWSPAFFEGVDVRTTAPSERVHVGVERGGERLEATLGDALAVVDVTVE